MKITSEIIDGSFAEACFDQNTCRELVEALLQKSADKTDCKTWNITPTEWRKEMATALLSKIEDLKENQKGE